MQNVIRTSKNGRGGEGEGVGEENFSKDWEHGVYTCLTQRWDIATEIMRNQAVNETGQTKVVQGPRNPRNEGDGELVQE